jgi:hypothetical protein
MPHLIEELGPDALATVSAFQIIGVGDHRVSPQSTPLNTTSSRVGR